MPRAPSVTYVDAADHHAASETALEYPRTVIAVQLLTAMVLLFPAVSCLIIYYTEDGKNAVCDKDVPLFLLVNGWTSVAVEMVHMIALTVEHFGGGEGSNPGGHAERCIRVLKWVYTLPGFFLIAWWILGNIWIWGTHPCELRPIGNASDKYYAVIFECCDPDLHFGARVYLYYTYLALSACMCCSCWLGCAAGITAAQKGLDDGVEYPQQLRAAV